MIARFLSILGLLFCIFIISWEVWLIVVQHHITFWTIFNILFYSIGGIFLISFIKFENKDK